MPPLHSWFKSSCKKQNNHELERCEKLIKQFSDDIGMSFGLDRCAVLTIKRGKSTLTDADILPNIPQLDKEDGYRYLVIYEGADFLMDWVKQAIKKEYLSLVRSILKAQLTGDSTMTAIGAYAVPVMRYTFGVIQWTKTELQQLDKKTRQILTANGCVHPKLSIHHLYLHRSKGGHSLTSIKDTHTHKCTSLAQ